MGLESRAAGSSKERDGLQQQTKGGADRGRREEAKPVSPEPAPLFYWKTPGVSHVADSRSRSSLTPVLTIIYGQCKVLPIIPVREVSSEVGHGTGPARPDLPLIPLALPLSALFLCKQTLVYPRNDFHSNASTTTLLDQLPDLEICSPTLRNPFYTVLRTTFAKRRLPQLPAHPNSWCLRPNRRQASGFRLLKGFFND